MLLLVKPVCEPVVASDEETLIEVQKNYWDAKFA